MAVDIDKPETERDLMVADPVTVAEAKKILEQAPYDPIYEREMLQEQPEFKKASDIYTKAYKEAESNLEQQKQAGNIPKDAVIYSVEDEGVYSYMSGNAVQKAVKETGLQWRGIIDAREEIKKAGGLETFLEKNPAKKETAIKAGYTPQTIADTRVSIAQRTREKTPMQKYKDISRAVFDTTFLPFISGYREAKEIGKKEAKQKISLSSETNKITKQLLLHEADITVPGVYVGRNWNNLDAKSKALNIAIDIGAILIPLGIARIAGVTGKAALSMSKAGRLAKTAGKTSAKLAEATKAYNSATKLKSPVNLLTKQANNVQKLQRASMKADEAFLNELGKLNKISKRNLKLLENKSGIKGIEKTITNVTKAQKAVTKSWKKVDSLGWFNKPKTPLELNANKQTMKAVVKLQKAQSELDSALANAGSTLQPRYKPSAPADTFKGFKVVEAESPKAPREPTTIEAIENYLRTDRQVKPTGNEKWVSKKVEVAVKEKTSPKIEVAEKKTTEIKLSAMFEKTPAEAKVKPKASELPKTKSGKPVIRETAIPSEYFGRMTYDQIRKYYRTEEFTDAVADVVKKQWHKVSSKPIDKTQVRTITKDITDTAIHIINKNEEKGSTITDTQQELRTQVNNEIRDKIVTMTGKKTSLEAKAAIETKTTTKTGTLTDITTKIPYKPIIPRTPVIPPVYVPSEDREKRRKILSAKGAIAWRQGELHKKDRWDVVLSPYTREQDYMIILGRKPSGAIIVKGPGSAYKTARLIYGHRLERPVLVNQPGIFSTELAPLGTRTIRLTFHKDAAISKKIGGLENKGRVFPLS